VVNTAAPKSKYNRTPIEDRILYVVVNLIIILTSLIILYPLVFVLSSAFSSPAAVSSGKVLLFPVDFSLRGFQAVFSYNNVLSSFGNSIFYTVAGTVINMAMTLICAYPLSRKDCPFRNAIMGLFTFTMFFSGGLIPFYMLMARLGFVNTIWSILLPGAISVYNMIVTRTFISSTIPGELLEAAQIDGCSDARFFFEFVLPLSKPVIAVIALYYGAGHWNAYFNAMMYLNDPKLYPLQLVLRDILISNQFNMNEMTDPALIAANMGMQDLLKYSLIVISSAPLMLAYPFVQKHFIKGVMLGSVKG